MVIVHVHAHVKPEAIEPFHDATIENATNSIQEAGVVRFDVFQSNDDPTRFLLIEIYREVEDAAKHKETAHYLKWRDTVADMMAEPRSSVRYSSVFQPDYEG